MFYSLSGEIIAAEPGFVAISCGGIGFKCLVSGTTQRALPAIGQTATLFTHLNVTQDAFTLYGFADKSELACFRLLTGVSGIGSKTALSVLSAISPAQLAICVTSGDHKTLTRAQGIGPKQAQRIVLELKDKMKSLEPASNDLASSVGEISAPPVGSNADEAVRALMVLGYSSTEASEQVAKLDASLPVEQLISLSLRAMCK